jgi:transposase
VSRKPNIGIRELKENLSAVVDSAWEHPVSVHRYGSPWVWIVSHEVWSRNTRRVEFNPAGHPLAALREHLDRAVAASQPRLHAAAIRAMLRIEVQPLLRALAIQLLYGVETEAGLHEQISCNLLFRWFVGLSLDQEIWSPQEFGQALERVLASADMIDILAQSLDGAPVTPIEQATGIALNRPLLQAWRARAIRPE